MPPVNETAREGNPLVRDPIYHQLHGVLRGLLEDGRYRPGDRFLTERQVGERFGVSRVTANKALSNLVMAGRLELRKGVGTFVRGGFLDNDLRSLVSFTRRAVQAGKKPSTRVLAYEVLPAAKAGPEIAAALRVLPGQKLIHMERLRLADAVPVIFEKRWLAHDRCPGLRRRHAEGSLYGALEDELKIRIQRVEQRIRAVALEADMARRLEAKPHAAALWVRGTGYGEEPLWWEDTYYRGEIYEFRNSWGGTSPHQGMVAGPTESVAPSHQHV